MIWQRRTNCRRIGNDVEKGGEDRDSSPDEAQSIKDKPIKD